MDRLVVEKEDILIKTPFRWYCCGPSGSGKTSFLRDLLNHHREIFQTDFNNIVYCYGINQPLYKDIATDLPNIIWIEGFPAYIESTYLDDPSKHDLLILDDLVDVVSESPKFRDIYFRNSHHKNYSVITVTQNPFYTSKFLRAAGLQCSGYVIFNCFRDRNQICTLSRQISQKNSGVIIDAYDQCAEFPFEYLYVDFTPHCKNNLRVRGNIVPDKALVVYQQE